MEIMLIKLTINANLKNMKRLQSKQQTGSFRNVGLLNYYNTMCQIYVKNGIKGFYSGYKPALLRASLNMPCLQLFTNEFVPLYLVGIHGIVHCIPNVVQVL